MHVYTLRSLIRESTLQVQRWDDHDQGNRTCYQRSFSYIPDLRHILIISFSKHFIYVRSRRFRWNEKRSACFCKFQDCHSLIMMRKNRTWIWHFQLSTSDTIVTRLLQLYSSEGSWSLFVIKYYTTALSSMRRELTMIRIVFFFMTGREVRMHYLYGSH